MDDEAVDLLRDLVADWIGRRPQRVTVRAWLTRLRQRGSAGAAPREPVAWLVTCGDGRARITDQPQVARVAYDLGDRVEPLFTGIP